MGQKALPPAEAARTLDLVKKYEALGHPLPGEFHGKSKGAVAMMAEELGVPAGAAHSRYNAAVRVLGKPDWAAIREARMRVTVAPPPPPTRPMDAMLLLKAGPGTLDELAARGQITAGAALDALRAAQHRGLAVTELGGVWRIETAPRLGIQQDGFAEIVADDDGHIRIAAIGDTHLCSKYAREDCLADFYAQVQHRGIRHVLHAGNWIDGEANFNRYDINVHGMDAQIRYMAARYPRVPGVETWSVTGDDHEGWYAQREGVNIGRYAERVMQEEGHAWRDLGYMEAYVHLKHRSGAGCKLHLMHPGGGSSYAVSYKPQKIIESYDGGEKPAVLLIGHYHKASYNMSRNVHAFQVGAFQDQTPFMRKKGLSSHVAGWFLDIELDAETGAVVEIGQSLRHYFVSGYYNNRWSHHGDVALPERAA